MTLMRGILIIALAVGLSLMAVERAQACSCAREKIGPGRLHLGTGDTLPADAPGIPWSGTPNMTRDQLADTTLRITEHVERPVQSQWAVSGACSSPVVADALAFSVDLPPEVEPFRGYLLYATFVDDLAWEHAENKCATHGDRPDLQ